MGVFIRVSLCLCSDLSKIHTQVEEKEEEEEEEETRSAKQCLQCPKSDASILTFLSVSCNKYSKKRKKKEKKEKAEPSPKSCSKLQHLLQRRCFFFFYFRQAASSSRRRRRTLKCTLNCSKAPKPEDLQWKCVFVSENPVIFTEISSFRIFTENPVIACFRISNLVHISLIKVKPK